MHDEDQFCNRAEVREALDDVPQNPSIKETIGDVINARFHRRDVVRGMLGVAAITSVVSPALLLAACSDDDPTGGEAIQLFSASAALFVENQGQWPDASVRYAFHGSGIIFLVFRSIFSFKSFQRKIYYNFEESYDTSYSQIINKFGLFSIGLLPFSLEP